MPLPVFPSDSLGAGDPATGAPLPLSDAASALVTASLPDTCTNTRQVNPEPDGAGGFTPVDPVALGPWACRLMDEPKPATRVAAGGETLQVNAWEMQLQLDADVRGGDGLDHNGRRYAVLDCVAVTGATKQRALLEWLGHMSAS